MVKSIKRKKKRLPKNLFLDSGYARLNERTSPIKVLTVVTINEFLKPVYIILCWNTYTYVSSENPFGRKK
jgi:hypothetical protein